MRQARLWVGISILLASVVYAAYVVSRMERYSLPADVKYAQRQIEIIMAAEDRCFDEASRYIGLAEIRLGFECGKLPAAIEEVRRGGYTVDLSANVDSYQVRIVPGSADRAISLYADQTHQIHLGTRDQPATSQNVILNRDPPK